MKFITCLFLISLSSSLSSYSQAPDWEWAKKATSNSNSFGNDVVTDKLGNIYTTGEFAGNSISFDNVTINSTSTYGCFFVAKHDDNGDCIWAQKASSYHNAGAIGKGISIDANNDLYVCGYYYGDYVVFENDTLKNTGIDANIFIAKLDSSGNFIWAKGFDGCYDDQPSDIAIDADGNIYITGFFKSTSISFDTISLSNPFPGHSTSSPFVVKFDSTGHVIWAKRGSVNLWSGNSQSNGIAIDSSGYIYIAGFFDSNTLNFDTLTISNPLLHYANIFIAKYNNLGNVLWAKSIGGLGKDYGNSITTDSSGNFYVLGTFQSNYIVFDSDTLFNSTSNNNFIVKYNGQCVEQWARRFGKSNLDVGTNIASDYNGTIFITGNFYSDYLIFDNDTITKIGGSQNIFIANYDDLGNFKWAKNSGGLQYDNYSYGVTANIVGSPYITGFLRNNPLIFDNDTLSFSQDGDYFLAKVSYVSINPKYTSICYSDSVQLKVFGAVDYYWSPMSGLDSYNDSIVMASPTITTTYTITGIKNGFTANTTAIVTILPLPITPVISQDGDTLFSSAITNVQWYRNDTIIPNAIHSKYIFSQNGDYVVCTTDNHGCTSCSIPYSIIDVGFYDNSIGNLVTIAPNPNNGFFHITSTFQTKKIEVIDYIGNRICSFEPNSRNIGFQLSNIANGIYFIRINGENNEIVIKKLVINN